jgi:hypothetical protein
MRIVNAVICGLMVLALVFYVAVPKQTATASNEPTRTNSAVSGVVDSEYDKFKDLTVYRAGLERPLTVGQSNVEASYLCLGKAQCLPDGVIVKIEHASAQPFSTLGLYVNPGLIFMIGYKERYAPPPYSVLGLEIENHDGAPCYIESVETYIPIKDFRRLAQAQTVEYKTDPFSGRADTSLFKALADSMAH